MKKRNEIIVVTEKINPEQLKHACDAWFGDMVKLVVDIEKEIVGVGGELHADAEGMLVERGSRPEFVWGINFYPFAQPEHRIEYTALVNIRPRQDNPGMDIQNQEIRKKIDVIIEKRILSKDEKLV